MTPKTAFIVDDEVFIALDFEQHMLELGYDIMGPAFGLHEATEVLETSGRTPSIALLDINIGGKLVWPLARQLRKLGTPLIFISANSNHEELRTEFAEAPVLDKSASRDDIAEAVGQIFG